MRLTKEGIVAVLEAQRDKLKALGVSRIGLFGSYLHGTQHPDSDLDLLVSFEHSSFDAYMETKFLLEDLFQKKVDLVLETELRPHLQYVKEQAAYAAGL